MGWSDASRKFHRELMQAANNILVFATCLNTMSIFPGNSDENTFGFRE